jgi:hypothetical protein
MKKLLMLMLVLTTAPAYAGDNRALWIWYGLNGAPSPQRHQDRQRYDNNDPYRRQHEQWNSGNGDFKYSGNDLTPWHQKRATGTMNCARLNDGSTVCVSQQ